jgi:phospholipid transport system substrate-binding protein
MNRILKIVAVVATLSAPAAALAGTTNSEDAARAIVGGVGNEILSVLRTGCAEKQRCRDAIGRVLVGAVDFDRVSRSVLGTAARRTSRDEMQEFKNLFATYLIHQALDQLLTIDVTAFDVGNASLRPNGFIKVKTRVQRPGDAINLDWSLRPVDGGLRIVDVLLDGYSLVIHFNNEFERRARRNVGRMIEILRQEVSGSRLYGVVQSASAG